ncbi:MAG: 2Fe-2S iron-sulfur cluster-binding protein [Pseudomonadota bacterium]
MVRLVFIMPDGVTRRVVEAEPGRSLLDVARDHDIDAIEGACEGAMACSTCHVILSEADYARLPPPVEDEEDMLDLAYGARPTSRLGCQVVVGPALEGAEIRLPHTTKNLLF